MKRRTLIAVVAALVAAFVAAGPATAADLPDTNAGGFTRVTFLNFYGGTITLDIARQLATENDVVVANDWHLRDWLDIMRAANPAVVLLAYRNGMMQPSGKAFPRRWYLRDAEGRRVRSKGWGNFLMHGRRAGWKDHVADLCEQSVRHGYDGCFLDLLGPAPLLGEYNRNGLAPIDPRTGRVFRRRAYLNMTSRVGRAVRERVAPRPVIGNGLGSYVRPYRRLLTRTDGGLAEIYLRLPRAKLSAWPSAGKWATVMQNTIAGQADGHVFTTTKIWRRHTSAAAAQWRGYAVASILIANRGRLVHEFTNRRSKPWTDDAPIYAHADLLGRPQPGTAYGSIGEHRTDEGAYVRAYEHGLVAVNPTGSSVYVTFSGTMVDQDGQVHDGGLTLRPRRGVVLVGP